MRPKGESLPSEKGDSVRNPEIRLGGLKVLEEIPYPFVEKVGSHKIGPRKVPTLGKPIRDGDAKTACCLCCFQTGNRVLQNDTLLWQETEPAKCDLIDFGGWLAINSLLARNHYLKPVTQVEVVENDILENTPGRSRW